MLTYTDAIADVGLVTVTDGNISCLIRHSQDGGKAVIWHKETGNAPTSLSDPVSVVFCGANNNIVCIRDFLTLGKAIAKLRRLSRA